MNIELHSKLTLDSETADIRFFVKYGYDKEIATFTISMDTLTDLEPSIKDKSFEFQFNFHQHRIFRAVIEKLKKNDMNTLVKLEEINNLEDLV